MLRFLLFCLQLLLVSIVFANSFKIQEIKFIGLNKVSKAAVLQQMPVKVGATMTAEDPQKIIDALFRTGFFKDIKVNRDNNVLIVNVVERPSIASIAISGIKDKDEVVKILKKHQLVEGWIFDPVSLTRAQEEIEKHYLTKGRYGVLVETKVTDIKDQVKIGIHIYEGHEARIVQVKIVGNNAFKEKELIKEFHHKKTNMFSWFTKKDRYSKEKMAADLETLQSYYFDRGYINMQVESNQVSLTPDQKKVYITININEGAQYSFSKVKLVGNLKPAEDKLNEIVDKIKEGVVFSRKFLLDIKQELEDALADVGYLKAVIEVEPEIDEVSHSVAVTFTVNPGKPILIRKVEFEGNHLTKDSVYRYGILQLEGALASRKNINEVKEYALREGFVSKIDIEHQDVPMQDDMVDLKVKVEEQRTANINGGVSWSKADRFMFNVGADLKNFLGSGKDIKFDFEKSHTTTTYSFGYFDPFYTPDGIGLGYNLYYSDRNLSKVSRIFDYSSKSFGGDVRWVMPMSLYSNVFFIVGADKTRLRINDGMIMPREVSSFTNSSGTKFTELNLGLGWSRNSLDHRIFPTKGNQQKVIGRITSPTSKLKYYTLEYSTNWFYPATKRFVLQLSTQFGYGNSYRKNQLYPFFKNFFAGGANTVRGFEERSLGPKDSFYNDFGGNLLGVIRSQINFPPPFFPDAQSVRTSLFVDAGQVYDTNYRHRRDKQKVSINPTGLRYSAGVSLTWHMPLGPVVFSYGWPLKKKRGDDVERFSFNISTNMF